MIVHFCDFTEMLLCERPGVFQQRHHEWMVKTQKYHLWYCNLCNTASFFSNMFILCVNPWFTAIYPNSNMSLPLHSFPPLKEQSTLQGMAGCNTLAKLR